MTTLKDIEARAARLAPATIAFCQSLLWPPVDAVRVDTLTAGTRFRDVQGGEWTFVRQSGGNAGAYVVRNDDGVSTWFAGCACVVPIGGER